MKYKLNINNQTIEVEIEDINKRPIIAKVDGLRFEVMPENGRQAEVKPEAGVNLEPKPSLPIPGTLPPAGNHILFAPLPGTVLELFVKPGEQVEAGQVVLVIEAMKMKNSIRSIFSGIVDNVLVSQGQSVAHKQALIEFAESA